MEIILVTLRNTFFGRLARGRYCVVIARAMELSRCTSAVIPGAFHYARTNNAAQSLILSRENGANVCCETISTRTPTRNFPPSPSRIFLHDHVIRRGSKSRDTECAKEEDADILLQIDRTRES